jgi:hypothetical protein
MTAWRGYRTTNWATAGESSYGRGGGAGDYRGLNGERRHVEQAPNAEYPMPLSALVLICKVVPE